MRVEARLLIPDLDEKPNTYFRAPKNKVIGVPERVEIEHALSCGERPCRVIAEDFEINERTVQRIAAKMCAEGRRVRAFARDLQEETAATLQQHRRSGYATWRRNFSSGGGSSMNDFWWFFWAALAVLALGGMVFRFLLYLLDEPPDVKGDRNG